jgi:hypothetical protein
MPAGCLPAAAPCESADPLPACVAPAAWPPRGRRLASPTSALTPALSGVHPTSRHAYISLPPVAYRRGMRPLAAASRAVATACAAATMP